MSERGHLVAVSLWDFTDEFVSSEHPEVSADPRGSLPGVLTVTSQIGGEIPVPEAGDKELSTVDGRHEVLILLTPGAQSSIPMTSEHAGTADGFEEFT